MKRKAKKRIPVNRKKQIKAVKKQAGNVVHLKTKQLWMQKALNAGHMAGENRSILEQADHKKALNEQWNYWRKTTTSKMWPWELYNSIVAKYVEGFSHKTGINTEQWMLMPTNKKVAVVVTVMNEEKTISSVIQQLNRLPIDELIVVVNGSTDNSFSITRKISSAVIIQYPTPLGHDVGRAIGAKMAQSDILLFLDGDFPVFAEHLIPFIYAVDQGKDVVLNNIAPYIHLFSNHDSVTVMKEFLNRSLSRPDLGANSLTAIPHALSKKAVDSIGYQDLIVPPKALAKAIQLGLSIDSPMSVDVIAKNKHRGMVNEGGLNPVADMIIGDHLEALQSVMESEGKRLYYQDVIRKRELVGGNGQ